MEGEPSCIATCCAARSTAPPSPAPTCTTRAASPSTPTLLERADILPHQEVEIWNVTNGERFRTYALRGQPGSGVVCINGAAAHKARKGDLVIIATFGWMTEDEARAWEPKLVFVDERNRP